MEDDVRMPKVQPKESSKQHREHTTSMFTKETKQSEAGERTTFEPTGFVDGLL
jgi:hypothetical protein